MNFNNFWVVLIFVIIIILLLLNLFDVKIEFFDQAIDKVTNDKRYQNDHGTIQDILNDADIKPTYKTDAIAYSVLVKCNVMLDDLEDFLRGYEETILR